MPENTPDPSASDSADYHPTPVELDRALAEMARVSLQGHYAYACGALRFVAEELVTGRADEHTIAAARYALALAEVARGASDHLPEVA
ncbi:hypothetical protein [Pseudofrankia inefficax]|uniref:Uncharacterized protein n=1 Tax=Pseudofrankia inefficax (strain DSM 45817 / CECT 9037 / DDB 130130 / EuI1c) TaxID=298654 RepID=E3J276_PSEI1|nr:hypothetical protein [Pseudofrankia inefficax]ADP78114.1 hypothetical protein FraEuI1c_0026 [Pseudofrankia inefficax]